MRFNPLFLLLASVSILAACQPAETTTAVPSANKPTTAVATPNPVISPTVAPTPTAVIGIAVCDDYLNKYEACLHDKLPEASRASFQSGLDAMRSSWIQLASNPQTAPALESACVQAKSSAAVAMQAYDCKFD